MFLRNARLRDAWKAFADVVAEKGFKDGSLHWTNMYDVVSKCSSIADWSTTALFDTTVETARRRADAADDHVRGVWKQARGATRPRRRRRWWWLRAGGAPAATCHLSLVHLSGHALCCCHVQRVLRLPNKWAPGQPTVGIDSQGRRHLVASGAPWAVLACCCRMLLPHAAAACCCSSGSAAFVLRVAGPHPLAAAARRPAPDAAHYSGHGCPRRLGGG